MQESFKIPTATFPTLTDSIVTFNSQYAGLPLKSHKIALTPTQSGSGTPSPDNIRSINGVSTIGVSATGLNLWGGKALLQSFKQANIASSIVDEINNTFTFSAYDGRNASILGTGQFKPNTLYTLLLTIEKGNNATSSNLQKLYSDGTKEYFGLPTAQAGLKQFFAVKTDPNKTFIGLAGYNQSSTTKIYCDECCVLEGDKTTDDFVSFGTFVIINLGGTYYGGEYDARTGVLTVTHLGVDMGSLTWEKYTGIQSPYIIFFTTLTGRKENTNILVDNCEFMGNYYSASFAYDGLTHDYSLSGGSQASSSFRGYVRIDSATTASDVVSALSGHILVYELATPQTIQLAPCPIDTLEGVNNIWADTGGTTLQYPKFG